MQMSQDAFDALERAVTEAESQRDGFGLPSCNGNSGTASAAVPAARAAATLHADTCIAHDFRQKECHGVLPMHDAAAASYGHTTAGRAAKVARVEHFGNGTSVSSIFQPLDSFHQLQPASTATHGPPSACQLPLQLAQPAAQVPLFSVPQQPCAARPQAIVSAPQRAQSFGRQTRVPAGLDTAGSLQHNKPKSLSAQATHQYWANQGIKAEARSSIGWPVAHTTAIQNHSSSGAHYRSTGPASSSTAMQIGSSHALPNAQHHPCAARAITSSTFPISFLQPSPIVQSVHQAPAPAPAAVHGVGTDHPAAASQPNAGRILPSSFRSTRPVAPASTSSAPPGAVNAPAAAIPASNACLQQALFPSRARPAAAADINSSANSLFLPGRPNPDGRYRPPLQPLPLSTTNAAAAPPAPASDTAAGSRLKDLRYTGALHYAYTAAEVNCLCDELIREQPEVVGLDLEWRPTFKKGQAPRKTALIQLCYQTRAVDPESRGAAAGVSNTASSGPAQHQPAAAGPLCAVSVGLPAGSGGGSPRAAQPPGAIDLPGCGADVPLLTAHHRNGAGCRVLLLHIAHCGMAIQLRQLLEDPTIFKVRKRHLILFGSFSKLMTRPRLGG